MYSNKQKKIQKFSNGRWKSTEHQRFIKGLQRFGKNWQAIQKMVKTRTLVQVRSHAQKVFKKMSEQDIESLFGDQSSHYQQMFDQSQSSEGTENYIQKNQQQTKLKGGRIDLVQIFMKAIQQETRSHNNESGSGKVEAAKGISHQQEQSQQSLNTISNLEQKEFQDYKSMAQQSIYSNKFMDAKTNFIQQ